MSSIILVDFSPIIYRNLFMNKDFVKDSDYNGLVHLILYSLIKIRKDFIDNDKLDYDDIVLVFDSVNSWRKEYFKQYINEVYEDYDIKEYKGHRVKDEDIDWNKVFKIVDEIKEYLDKYSDYKIVQVDKCEADDIIYVFCNEYNKQNKNVLIISSDKDFIQLLKFKNVKIYDPLKKIYKEADGDIYLLKHILIGDKSDGIPAVKERLGVKTAEKMLKDLNKLLKIDLKFKKRFLFNKKLIDLSEIPSDIYENVKEKINIIEKQGKYNQQKLIELCQKYQLKKVVEDLDKFKLKKKKMKIDDVF